MRVYLKQNVFDAALDRIRRLYDEFPEVVVNFSGGKDSTVLFNLCLIVAREKKRLPLKVFWLDQEAEWNGVVEFQRATMNHPDVEPLWFQGPFRLFNATTTADDPWLHCWAEGEEWVRPRESNSIHVNDTGTDRFGELFEAYFAKYFSHTRLAKLSGVRCEESPARLAGLTGTATYKDITWGNTFGKKFGHYLFYPLYDWGWRDIWTAIHKNGWPYCRIYDLMFQYGVAPRDMRVSNVHHETALAVLWFLQEIEPATWDAVVRRVKGINAVGRCGEAYRAPKELPKAFKTWREYRDYLVENLIADPAHRQHFYRRFAGLDRRYAVDDPEVEENLMRHCVRGVLINDWEGVLDAQYTVTQGNKSRSGRKRREGGQSDHWSIAARRAREAAGV